LQMQKEKTNILLKKFTAESVEKYFQQYEQGKETANLIEEIAPI
jgi:hypothetical protein